MVNDSRRKRIHIEISHLIRSDDHSASLRTEDVHDFLEGGGILVDIVAVELYGIHSATGIMHCRVPATSDAQVISVRHNHYETRVVNRSKSLGSAVRGMIVHHYDIVREIAFLRKSAMHCIRHGPDPVKNRYND